MRSILVVLVVLGASALLAGCDVLLIADMAEHGGKPAFIRHQEDIKAGRVPADEIAFDCNQKSMTRRSARNDGSWDSDPAILKSCLAEKGWAMGENGQWERLEATR